MANKLNIVDEITVTMTTSNTDAFYTASKAAKKAGSREVCGFATVVRYDSGAGRRVWVAYSNGAWTNCVDAECFDGIMQRDFEKLVRHRAEEADLELGYRSIRWTTQDNEDAMQRELLGMYN